jgi:hypothetical protein
MKYRRIYNLLKASGHSPVKAGQILLDAARGDQFSIDWIKALYQWRTNVRC